MERRKKSFEELEFTDDFLFAQIMRGTPELCRELLQHILGIAISEIRYLKTQETIDSYLDAKAVRLDVVARDGSVVYNVEMQTAAQKNLARRSRYYQSQLDTDMLQKGEEYDNLPDSYIIFLCTFDPYAEGRCIYRFHNVCKDDMTLELGDGTTKVFINSKGTDNVGDPLKELFSYMNNPKRCNPQQKLTKMIAEQVEKAKLNAEWRQMYMKYQMDLSEARKEGEKNRSRKTALEMLKNGEPRERILLYSGLTEEELEALEEEACART